METRGPREVPGALSAFEKGVSFCLEVAASTYKGEIIRKVYERIRKLRESKKTDLFYHLLRNVLLSFLNHAGAQHSELLTAARSRHEQKEFKGADARVTAATVAPPRAPRRA
ncbi:hypothetical protein EVAR_65085_1 [Eumeta japonica]|uniref:Uncharacterized protein n=1 Tax=Eumeta variegata TaxID=151549 RepID=A0A4C1Z0N9_EUMVA|nr:hypothetical protein EVAR_65085_1 [Eumeta japonica]